MLYRATLLKTYALKATDDQIGKINHFYFDEESWKIRYAIVDTGKIADPTDNWFTGRQILLPPEKISAIDTTRQLVTTQLTRKEIEESPPITTDRPVTMQTEEGNYNSLGWPVAWYGPDYQDKEWDPHLQSTKAVTGYHIQATDGEIGHVEDFVVDDQAWTIQYLIISTRNWWPGKKVLISPRWIQEVRWEESKVHVALSRGTIQSAPEFTDASVLNREFEAALFTHYNKEQYWPK